MGIWHRGIGMIVAGQVTRKVFECRGMGALMSRPAALLAVALDVRLRPRLASGAFAAAAAVADLVFLAGGVLLTRISTRSAVSRSVNCAVTVVRSISCGRQSRPCQTRNRDPTVLAQ